MLILAEKRLRHSWEVREEAVQRELEEQILLEEVVTEEG